MQAMYPDLRSSRDRLGHRVLPYVHGAAFIHRVYGSLAGPAVLGSDARAAGETVMEDKTAGKSAGALAIVAGLIARVKLARVESREIQSRNPRVRCAISDSVDIAQMVLAEAMKRQ
jgi:hypothetical protein